MIKSALGLMVRKVAAVGVACSFVLTTGGPALAQQPVTPRQTPPDNGMGAPLSRPLPTRTVGLDPDKVVSWTLRDAIVSALEKNVDIELERENVKLAGFDIIAAYGIYDLNSSTSTLYESAKRPNSFPFSGTTDNFTLNDTVTFNSSLVQNVQK